MTDIAGWTFGHHDCSQLRSLYEIQHLPLPFEPTFKISRIHAANDEGVPILGGQATCIPSGSPAAGMPSAAA